jgi:hypothetical protein
MGGNEIRVGAAAGRVLRFLQPPAQPVGEHITGAFGGAP